MVEKPDAVESLQESDIHDDDFHNVETVADNGANGDNFKDEDYPLETLDDEDSNTEP